MKSFDETSENTAYSTACVILIALWISNNDVLVPFQESLKEQRQRQQFKKRRQKMQFIELIAF